MKVILIDDEQNALDYLDDLLHEYTNIEIVGKYLNPLDGLEKLEEELIDVVFLDINLPGGYGINIAKQLNELYPDLHIVFVTAYNQYAVNAFEVDALDYIVKPVTKERLDKTFERITQNTITLPSEANLKITMFNKVQFNLPEEDPVLMQFKLTKTQHVFIYLLHFRTKLVRKDELIDLLWDDLDEKRAYSQLYNAIYIIRKELAPYEKYISITTYSDSYRLELNHTVVDVEQFEFSLPTLPRLDENSLEQFIKVIELYKGDYLVGYDYYWADNERYRLQMLWVNVSLDLVAWYYAQKMFDEATALSLEISTISPLTEDAYFYLMKISAEKEVNSAVHFHFSRLKEVLGREIQEAPSQKIDIWYNTWRELRDK